MSDGREVSAGAGRQSMADPRHEDSGERDGSAMSDRLREEIEARKNAERQLADLRERVDNAQVLADMGDYDWHIPSDTNRWSDQLFRIYGCEPQSFNPSYERFLSFIHPDDRDRIREIHQRAYATGEPYQMVERIVRADGEMRYLSSNGQVVFGADGNPERMRGTCIDITERVEAERSREIATRITALERQRREHAVEINDTLIQAVSAAVYALELHDMARTSRYLQACLSEARRMVTDLMAPLGESAEVGLIRQASADLTVASDQPEARPGDA